MMEYLFNGIGGGDVALTINRVAIGSFFAITGAFKLLKPSWRASLLETLRDDKVPFPRFNDWWVPSVEFSAGCAVVLGLLAPLAAAGLVVIMMVALYTEGPRMVAKMEPEGRIEATDDCLYLPETLYLLFLAAVVAGGAGPYSLDAIIWSLIER